MNKEISEYLKKCRLSKNLSRQNICEATGITDTRLMRVENSGNVNTLRPEEIRKLSEKYDIPIVEMLIKLGYLTNTDLNDFQFVFKGVSMLNDEEKKHVQNEINFINRKRGVL